MGGFLEAIFSPIAELRSFIAHADGKSAARRDWGVQTSYIFYQVLLTQPLIHIMVVQLRGLNGSMGTTIALMSWSVLLNLALLYTLLGLGYTRDQHGAHRPHLMNFFSIFFTLCTTSACGLAMYSRGTAAACPEGCSLLDLQFCNTGLPGMMPFDNLAFQILLMVFNYEAVPVSFVVTIVSMALGFAFMLVTMLHTFDARFLPGCLTSCICYLSACWYIFTRVGTAGSQGSGGPGTSTRCTDDSSVYSDAGRKKLASGLQSYEAGADTPAALARRNRSGSEKGGSWLSKEDSGTTFATADAAAAPLSWDETAALAVLAGAHRAKAAASGSGGAGGAGSIDGRWGEAKREGQEDGYIRASKADSFLSDITGNDFDEL